MSHGRGGHPYSPRTPRVSLAFPLFLFVVVLVLWSGIVHRAHTPTSTSPCSGSPTGEMSVGATNHKLPQAFQLGLLLVLLTLQCVETTELFVLFNLHPCCFLFTHAVVAVAGFRRTLFLFQKIQFALQAA